MNRYISGEKQASEILREIQRIAVLMKIELENGNITAFAELLNRHLKLSKQLDKNSINTHIEQIFDVCEDLIDGRFICGAGGGGFLQMILKKGATKDDLEKRLDQVFAYNGVEVWECKFV